MVLVDRDEPIGPFQPLHRLAYGFPEIAATGIDVVNQVDHRFRVRFRFKDVAQALKLPAQGFMVFDNPVVNQGEAVPGHVRVGVLFTGDPMGPAAMPMDPAVGDSVSASRSAATLPRRRVQ